MLVDEIDIILKGGHGGAGKVSFGKMMGSGPNGGNGGRGGDLYVEAVSDIYALNQFTKSNERAGEDGLQGGNKYKGMIRINPAEKEGRVQVIFEDWTAVDDPSCKLVLSRNQPKKLHFGLIA